jgi:hypothetical protein
MEQFKEIIDTYIENYSKFEKGKVSFDCEYGELIFFKDNSNILILFGIYIFPEQRNKGFCREILHYLIEQCTNKFDYFCVESVLSKILYVYLLRFKYKNKKFKKMKNGFIFKLK